MVGSRRLLRRLGVALNLRDPPSVPPYGWSYFDHLVAVYVTLNVADARADAVIRKSSENPDDLTWGDVFLLESVAFSLQPPAVVERSAWIVRERLHEIASPAIFDKYVNSNSPKDCDTPEKLALVKADLSRVLDVLHWYYALIPIRERLRKGLTLSCIWLISLYSVILGVGLYWCHEHGTDFLAMMMCVLYCGIVGGFVSSQRRMQRIPNEGDPLVSIFDLDSAGYYLWLSPLLGSIFAVTLTMMFVAGLLQGSIFPDFHISTSGVRQGLPFFHFTWNTLPKTSEDYAKLFVWAFLAGFLERLVPDSLDRLASKLNPSTKQATRVPNPVHHGPLPPPEPKPPITPETMKNVMHSGQLPPDPENASDANKTKGSDAINETEP